jgi:cell wall assembly regulator SMI1
LGQREIGPAYHRAVRTWRRLLDALGPAASRLQLRRGASETSIVAAETLMNVRFPADYRAWLAIADGQEVDSLSILPTGAWLISIDRLLVRWTEERNFDFADEDDEDLDDDLDDDDLDDDEFDDLDDDNELGEKRVGDDEADNEADNEDDNEDDGPAISSTDAIQPILVHPRRITIAGTELLDYDNTVLDLIPGPTGTKGQVINVVDGHELVVYRPSFDAYLERVAELVESGALVVHDTDVGLRLDPPGEHRRWDDLLVEKKKRAPRKKRP